MHNPIKSRKCFCCGSRYRLADHHLQPRESGGLNEERNLVTLCCTCHDAVEGQQEWLSAGDIWLNVLKRKESFKQEAPGRKRYRLSRENAQPCPAYVSLEDQARYARERRREELNSLSVREYFEQTDTPAGQSPAGELMVRVLAKNPGMSFEQAREEAHKLLDKAACRRVYRIPRVLSAEEQEREQLRLRALKQRRTTRHRISRCRPATNSPSNEQRDVLSRPGRFVY
jgi:hypothetical protein